MSVFALTIDSSMNRGVLLRALVMHFSLARDFSGELYRLTMANDHANGLEKEFLRRLTDPRQPVIQL